MLNKLKSEKGITGIDITVSLIVITMFISILTALSLNVSSSLTSKKMLEKATSCMKEIMEKVDELDYNSVEIINDFEPIKSFDEYYTDEDGSHEFREEIQNILFQKDENDKFKYNRLSVYPKVEDYKPEGETASLIKKVTIKIIYNLNNKEEVIEVTRLKTRYNIDLEETEVPVTN